MSDQPKPREFDDLTLKFKVAVRQEPSQEPPRAETKDILIELTHKGDYLNLEPVRGRAERAGEPEAAEYYLIAPGKSKPLVVSILYPDFQRKTVIEIDRPLKLGVVYYEKSKRALLIQGALVIDLFDDEGHDRAPNLRSLLKELWPTEERADVRRLILSPRGLHLEGNLFEDELFLPGRQAAAAAPLRVVLRPWHASDQAAPLEAMVNDLGLGTGKYDVWTLSSYVEPVFAAGVTADEFVGAWAAGLENASPHAFGLLDAVVWEKSPDAIVTVLKKEGHIGLYAQNLGLRVGVRGGQGGEASFLPKYLCVEAKKADRRKWQRSRAEFVSPAEKVAGEITPGEKGPEKNEPPEAIITLPADGTEATLDFKHEVEALTLPVTRTGRGSEGESYSAWLCADSGWLRVEAGLEATKVPGELVSGGPLSGAIELGGLMAGLTGAQRDGTSVVLGAWRKSRVALELKGDEPGELTLKLSVKDPFITVMTPALWYAQPAGGEAPPQLPYGEGDAEAALRSAFGAGAFVSRRKRGNKGPSPVMATIFWVTKKRAFTFSFPHFASGAEGEPPAPQRVTFWGVKEGIPWVQSFPLSPPADGMLDVNRGLIPMRPAAPAEAEVKFYARGLPEVVLGGGGVVHTPVARRTRYFLPTLPGVEAGYDEKSPPLTYRHSVPVLDEAYTMVSESGQAEGVPAELRGIDLGRVYGTVAFTLADGTGQLDGLLHRTAANPMGDTQVQVAFDEGKLKGGYSEIEVTVGKNRKVTRTLARVVKPSGSGGAPGLEAPGALTLNLEVKPDDGTSSELVGFKVDVAPDGEGALYRVVNNGQPLLAGVSDGRVVTGDAEGLVQEEPNLPSVAVRVLDGEVHHRLTGSIELGAGFVLELAGMPADLGAAVVKGGGAALARQQMWALHDGKGDWPQLFGFVFYPLALRHLFVSKGVPSVAEDKVVVRGRLLPALPSVGLQHAEGALDVTFVHGAEGWKLTGASGHLDWRFPAGGTEDNPIWLGRVRALAPPVGESPEADAGPVVKEIKFDVKRLDLGSPFGPVSVGSTVVGATLSDGKLLLDSFSANFGGALTLRANSLDIKPATEEVSPVLFSSYDFAWRSPLNAAGELEFKLTLEKAERAAGEWRAWIGPQEERPGEEPPGAEPPEAEPPVLDSRVSVRKAAANRYLCLLQTGEAPPPEVLWLVRKAADRGVIGLNFAQRPGAPPDEQGVALTHPELSRVAADVLMRLGTKSGDSFIIVRLRVSPGARLHELGFEMSGVLALSNQVAFTDGGRPVSHSVRIFLDRFAPDALTMATLLKGRGFAEPVSAGAVVEHAMSMPGLSRPVIWQVPQVVTFRGLGSYAEASLPLDRIHRENTLCFTIHFDRRNPLEIEDDEPLDEAVKCIEELAARGHRLVSVSVEGHADRGNEKRDEEPEEVAAQRAEKVKDLLCAYAQVEAAEAKVFARSWGHARPFKAAPGKENRRVTVQVGAELLVDAGAVFLMAVRSGPLRGPTRQASADLEGAGLRLALRSKESPEEIDTSEPLALVRLPFAAAVAAGAGRYAHTAQLKPYDDGTVGASPTYVALGAQPDARFAIPPAVEAEAVTMLRRGASAGWLNSDFLFKALLEPLAAEPGTALEHRVLRPQFRAANKRRFKLPEVLPDFEWVKTELRRREPAAAGHGSWPVAAAVVSQNPKLADDSEPERPAYLRFPFIAEVPLTNEVPPPNSAPGDLVQVFTFGEGGFSHVAASLLPPDASASLKSRALAWARKELRARQRTDSAVLLLNHTDFDLVTAPFQGRREELSDAPPWPLADEGGADTAEPDERCLRPDAFGPGAKLKLSAEPQLGLTVFGGVPVEPANDSPLPGISAVRFRVAPAGAQRGHLAEARVVSADLGGVHAGATGADAKVASGDLLGLSKLDTVRFEVWTPRGADKPFPTQRTRPFLERRAFVDRLRVDKLPSGENVYEARATTLLPPLVDVVAWSARPGETTRTLFAANRYGYRPGPGLMFELHAQGGTAVALRRARAVAGRGESIRLRVLESRRLFGERFYSVKFEVTQQLGLTPTPVEKEVVGVLATRNAFFPSEVSEEAAAARPALVYFDQGEGASFEPAEIYLLAGKFFTAPESQNAATLLLLTEKGSPLPQIIGKDPSQPENAGKFKVVAAVTIRAETALSIWSKSLTDSLREFAGSQGGKPATLILCSYTEMVGGGHVWQPGKAYFRISINPLNRGKSLVAPPLSLTLLAQSPSANGSDTRVAGFGRLGDKDFRPVGPTGVIEKQVRWARTAVVPLLDRLSGRALPSAKEVPFEYDVVLYGPGGELIPNEPSRAE